MFKDSSKINADEAAGVIERFLTGTSFYPQEWNDFVESGKSNKKIEGYRQICHELDPLVNQPGDPDERAIAELKILIAALRAGAM